MKHMHTGCGCCSGAGNAHHSHTHHQHIPHRVISTSTSTSTSTPPPFYTSFQQQQESSSHHHHHNHHHHHHHHHHENPFNSSKRRFQTKYNTTPTFTSDPNLLNKEKKHSIFTSSHTKIDRQAILDYLTRKNIVHKATTDKVFIMECPLCPKPTYGKSDNLWKLCIFENGGFMCLRCGDKGSWYDFKSKLGDLPELTTLSGTSLTYSSHTGSPPPAARSTKTKSTQHGNTDGANDSQTNEIDEYNRIVEQQTAHLSQTECALWSDSLEQFPEVLRYLTETRGLKYDILKKYKVGAKKQSWPQMNPSTRVVEWIEHDSITFPWTDKLSATNDTDVSYTRVKVRSLKEKKFMRLLPKGGPWGFFGWHTVPLNAKMIIITEGEFDAMAVHQATGLPSISLPNGANSLPPQLLPCLERFEKIILWMDDDQAGRDAIEGMVSKLGIGRTYIINGGYGAKDANEALLNKANISQIVDGATRLAHKQISTFNQFRNEVKRMFYDPNSQVGVAYPNMPVLQSLIKGHRRGELTILTGGTGVGKTTVLAQLSLELAMQNVNSLWGSFEIRNPRLVRTLMKQYAATQGIELNENNPEAFDYIADKFEELPFTFLKFYGSSPVQEVIEAMDYAVYVHDVQHIILDNLQFMLSGQGRASGDKFDLQDKAIEAFRSFASQRNVHVTIVIHPRKEADNTNLGLASVFGSAKATQEADNVLIIQGGLPRTVLRSITVDDSGKRGLKEQSKPDLSQHGGYDDPIIGEVLSTHFRTLELRKNRWDGDLGYVPMRFDKTASRFYELTSQDIQAGLGTFIQQERKKKQMDLIRHLNQNEAQNNSTGFQNMKQKQFSTQFRQSNNYNNNHNRDNNSGNGGGDGNNNDQQKRRQLTPEESFRQQFDQRHQKYSNMLDDFDPGDIKHVTGQESLDAFDRAVSSELQQAGANHGQSSSSYNNSNNNNNFNSNNNNNHNNNNGKPNYKKYVKPTTYEPSLDIIFE